MWLSIFVLLVSSASAETRPRYGGTIKVEMRASPQTLDPAAAKQDPGFAQIAPLLYDTLVQLDSAGRTLPSLALSWQQESDRRWRFTIRNGVHFSNGSVLTSAVVAQSLHEANPDWNLRTAGEVVVIETEQPLPNLLAVLALPRNSIVLRGEGKLLGTGPFRLSVLQPGRIIIAAADDCWHGQPFVGGIDIQFNRGLREQMLDLELNRADLVEVAPDQLARMPQSGRRVVASDPVDLLALRFSHSNVRDARVREAIALTVDRESIANVLLQRHGEPTAGLLPNWITGYSFLFAAAPQVARARQLRTEAKQTAPLTLVYDASDPLARLVAERVALNAADAGITLKTVPSTQNVTVPDLELVRMRLASTDPAAALADLARTDRLALPMPEAGGPQSSGGPPLSPPAFGVDMVGMADVYRQTVSALQDHWAIPIAYLPAAYAVSLRVRNWTRARDGSWLLENIWLEAR